MFSRMFAGEMPSRNFFSQSLSRGEFDALYPAIWEDDGTAEACPGAGWAEVSWVRASIKPLIHRSVIFSIALNGNGNNRGTYHSRLVFVNLCIDMVRFSSLNSVSCSGRNEKWPDPIMLKG